MGLIAHRELQDAIEFQGACSKVLFLTPELFAISRMCQACSTLASHRGTCTGKLGAAILAKRQDSMLVLSPSSPWDEPKNGSPGVPDLSSQPSACAVPCRVD